MRKSKKIWLTVAVSLILIGSILFLGVMAVLQWDFTKLSTGRYETNRYDLTDTVQSISVHTATAEISFLPSEDGTCAVVCYEKEKAKHTVTLSEGVLHIDGGDERKWYEHVGINFHTPRVTVYLPTGAYDALTVNSTTGAITVAKDFTFEDITIAETTGFVKNYASAT